jgi:hypothetical protein
MVTTEWLNVYCKDAVKNIQNILPWQGQPPQKAAPQLSVVGGRDIVVIDAIYKRGWNHSVVLPQPRMSNACR